MQGRRTKAQKDKPEGPSHPAGALACSRSPPSQGASQDPLDKPPPSLTGAGGLGGELLPVVCYEIVPKLLKQRRSSQLQQRKTQTMTAPPPNKEERHYS